MDDLTDLVILGAGGFAREVLDVVEAQTSSAVSGSRRYRFLGFVAPEDPDPAVQRRGRWLGGDETLPDLRGVHYLVGVGPPAVKRRLAMLADEAGLLPGTAIHPSATFGVELSAGPGLVVCAHVSLTCNIRLGRHVHLNLNCTVGHDAVLGDFVSVNPGSTISGGVALGAGVLVGTNSAVIERVTVGADTTIGAGAVVTRDLPPGVVAVGMPAKPR